MSNALQKAEGGKLPEVLTTTPQPMRFSPPPPLRSELRGTMWIGVAIVMLFFVIGGGWAATAPLSGAAIAGGMVSPESSRQTVQHLEGGIIREFRVREGDHVNANDVLLVLQSVSAQSEVGQLTARLRALAAQEARLEAERTGQKAIRFAHPSLRDQNDPEVRAAIERQLHQFETRKANDDTRVSILQQQIAQLQEQIAGADRQLQGVRRQRALIREELASVEELFRKGYEKKPRLLELKRTEAGLTGNEGELLSRAARAREAIGESRLEITNIRVERLAEVDKELTEVQTTRIEIEQQIENSLDKLTRTTLVAPVSGVVLNLRFKTPGGVIRPGEPVLDIVPEKDDLIIDARVSPRDIDDVHAGLDAYVIFPSYSQRTLHRIAGQVKHVSADSFEDERTGERYYQAKIKVDRDDLKREAPEIVLQAGLPAEVFITTTERTLLDYLVEPLSPIIERSFRETY